MNRIKKAEKIFNRATQVFLPVFTLGGFSLISLKMPGWGLLVNLSAQPFWLYSSWRSYRRAGQLGMFINVIAMTIITGFGVINYFFLSK